MARTRGFRRPPALRACAATFAVLVASVLLSACGGDDDDGESSAASKGGETTKELVGASWGGTFQEAIDAAYWTPFAAEHGLTVKQDEAPSLAKLKAANQANNVAWDTATVTSSDYENMVAQDLLEPIDYEQWPAGLKEELAEGAALSHGVVLNYYSCGITYRTDLDSQEHPRTWAEFWDTKRFPGPRAMPKGTYAIPPWEAALMADGVTPEELYPLDYDRALASLDKIKPDVTFWYDDTAAGVQALVDGEVDYAMLCNNRVSEAASQGAKVGVEWNQSLINYDVWVVPKGAPNAANAQQFMAFAAQAEPEAELMKAQPVGTPNLKALDLIDAELQATLPTAEKNLEVQVPIDPQFWVTEAPDGTSQVEYALTRWNEWFGQ